MYLAKSELKEMLMAKANSSASDCKTSAGGTTDGKTYSVGTCKAEGGAGRGRRDARMKS